MPPPSMPRWPTCRRLPAGPTRRLGMRWCEVENGIADIQGFDPDHLRAFSTRREQILEAAGEGPSPRALQIATLGAKVRDLTDASLRDLWREKATQLGLGRERSTPRWATQYPPDPPRLSADQIAQLVTADKSHFDRRDVIQAVANRLPAGAPGYRVRSLPTPT